MVTIDYDGVSTHLMIILMIELGIWVILACPNFNVHCSQKGFPLKRAWVPQGTFLWIRVPFFVKSPPFLFFVKRMQDKAACFVEHNFSKLKASHIVVFDGQTLCLKVCFLLAFCKQFWTKSKLDHMYPSCWVKVPLFLKIGSPFDPLSKYWMQVDVIL